MIATVDGLKWILDGDRFGFGQNWLKNLENDPPQCEEEFAGLYIERAIRELMALRLLVEWATDCDFGFDQFHDEYERYKDEIEGMKYIDAMIHVAERTIEDHGGFED